MKKLAILATLLGLGFSGPAWAEPVKVAIGTIKGPGAKEVTEALKRAIASDAGFEVVTNKDGAAAVINGVVSKAGKKLDAALTVDDPQGQTLKSWRIRAKKAARLAQLIEGDLWNRIGPTLKGLAGGGGGGSTEASPEAPAVDPNLRKVGLLKVEGSAKNKAELLVVGGFRSTPGLELVATEVIRGQALKLGLQLDDASGRVEIARALGLSAYLSLKLEEKTGGLEGTALVTDASDGRTASEAKASAKNSTNLSRDLKAATLPLFERTQAPTGKAAEAPKLAAAPPPPAAAPPPAPSGGGGSEPTKIETSAPDKEKAIKDRSHSPLEVAAGLKFFTRGLTYNDDLYGALRPYDLSGAPSLDAQLRWYPGAHFGSGLASIFGVYGQFNYALGLKTVDAMDREFATSQLAFGGGLRVRIPIGASELGVFGGYGQHAFTLDGTDGPNGIDFPSVSYGFLRYGADGRLSPFDGFHARFGFAWRQMLSAGEIAEADWFPRATMGGLDAQLGVGYEVVSGLEVQLGAELIRYFYSMNPEPGDGRVAGGAVDQYLSATLGVAFYL